MSNVQRRAFFIRELKRIGAYKKGMHRHSKAALQLIYEDARRLALPKSVVLHEPPTAPELLSALQKLWGFVEDLGKSNPGYLGKLVLQDYGRMNEAFLETELVLKKLQ